MNQTRTWKQVATVWLLHEEGRKELGHTDAGRAWAEAQALPGLTRERGDALARFNPVEINIRPDDAERAVAKWERITGQPGVCHVQVHRVEPWATVNEVYD